MVGSDLTLIECDHVLHRAVAPGAAVAANRRAYLAAAALHWNLRRIAPAIVDRARQPFPDEPIRTLDALHHASALHANAVLPGLALLSLDERVRRAGASLGFEIPPP